MFALLEHTPAGQGDPRHWDFLLEIAGAERAATWRLAENPVETAGVLVVERIADHRAVYFDYEGEISGGRGQVRRIDRGLATVAAYDGPTARFELGGVLLRGRFEIAAVEAGLCWRPRGS